MPSEPCRLVIGILIHDLALGGSERIAIRLGTAWAAAGARVELLVGDPRGPLASLIGQGLELHCPERPIVKRVGAVRPLGKWAGKAASDLGCDIVFVPGNWHFRAIAPLRRSVGRRTAIVAQLSNILERRDRRRVAGLVRRWSMRRRLGSADRVVAMSDRLARDGEIAVDRERLVVIASPILNGAVLPPAKAGTDLVALARLVPQKNLALAIRAFARLDRPDLRFVIAGEGRQRQALEALARRLGVREQVRFAGCVDDAESVLRDARLLLLPSAYEGFPAVAVEALAMGVPVVATTCSPAMAEIISTPEAGRIVTADPQAFAAAIADMLGQPPPDRAELAQRVAHHRIDQVSAEYLALFTTLAR